MTYLLLLFVMFALLFSVFCIVSIRRMPKAEARSWPYDNRRKEMLLMRQYRSVLSARVALKADDFDETYDRIMSKMPTDSPSRIKWEESGKKKGEDARTEWRQWLATRGQEIKEEIRQRRNS